MLGLKSLEQLYQYRVLADAIKRPFKLSDRMDIIELLLVITFLETISKTILDKISTWDIDSFITLT